MKINDIVKVVCVDAFYYGVLGRIDEVCEDEYHVVFEMIDEETEEVSIYEECYYYDYEIELVEDGC